MSITTAADAHLAELIELKEATAEMLIETRHAASVHRAHMCAANTRAELTHFISDSAINAADKPATGTKPCN